MSGKIEGIWLKRHRRGPMEAVPSVRAIEGSGLDGNVDTGGRRQVTILAAEAWDTVQQELATPLEPAIRRANFLVSGVDLEGTRDRVLELGSTAVRILGETTPCLLMEEIYPGLREALAPHWRGGAYGEVLRDGEVRLGDGVRWADEDESSGS